MDPREISSYILDKIPCECEVYCVRNGVLSVEVRDQKATLISEGSEFGIGLRVIRDRKAGFSYSSGGDLDDLIMRCVKMAGLFPSDIHNVLPPPEKYSEMDLFDEKIPSAGIDDKVRLSKEIEKAAYAHDKRIKKTESTGYREIETEVHIRSSNGIDASYRTNYCGGYAMVICSSNGDDEEGYYSSFSKKFKDLDPERIGKAAALKAVRLVNGRAVRSAIMPAVLGAEAASQLLETVSGMLSADAAQKFRSVFSGKKNSAVASGKISIVDDGLLKGGIDSSPFDDEGSARKKLYLVKDGTLQEYLHNAYTASKEGKKSAGNAKRPSFRFPPSISSSNLYIEPGKKSAEDLISSVDKGILILNLMALHTVNHVSGDFSLGASGLMIEKGKTTYPVRGITVSGNVIELLSSVEDIANDLEFFEQAGNCGSPSLLIGSMDISGN